MRGRVRVGVRVRVRVGVRVGVRLRVGARLRVRLTQGDGAGAQSPEAEEEAALIVEDHAAVAP